MLDSDVNGMSLQKMTFKFWNLAVWARSRVSKVILLHSVFVRSPIVCFLLRSSSLKFHSLSLRLNLSQIPHYTLFASGCILHLFLVKTHPSHCSDSLLCKTRCTELDGHGISDFISSFSNSNLLRIREISIFLNLVEISQLSINLLHGSMIEGFLGVIFSARGTFVAF